MYFPTFRMKKNGVPVLSKGEIEVIAYNFVRDFQPEALTVPQELKMEEFIECYLAEWEGFELSVLSLLRFNPLHRAEYHGILNVVTGQTLFSCEDTPFSSRQSSEKPVAR